MQTIHHSHRRALSAQDKRYLSLSPSLWILILIIMIVIFGAADVAHRLFEVDEKGMAILDAANHALASAIDHDNAATSSKNSMGASLFTGEDEVFAFARTVSRMREMQTIEFLQSAVSK